MLTYELYYRKFGLRLPGHLSSPPLFKVELLDLPRDVMYHYLGDTIGDPYPAGDEFILRYVKRIIPIQHITEIKFTDGNPRPITKPIEPIIKNFQARNRRYRRIYNYFDGLKDSYAPLVFNYGFLWGNYKYLRNYMSEYHKWHNVIATAWDNIGNSMSGNNRQHFYQLSIPKILPTVSDLRRSTTAITQQTFKIFNTHEAFMLLEIWKWLGDERESSFLTRAGGTNGDGYKRINLVFNDGGVVMLVNLGILDGWRNGSMVGGQVIKDGFDPSDLQLRFMRLLMKIVATRVEGIPEGQEVVELITDVGNAQTLFSKDDETTGDVNLVDSKSVGVGGVSKQVSADEAKLAIKREKLDKKLEEISIASMKNDQADLKALHSEIEGLDEVRQMAMAVDGDADVKDAVGAEVVIKSVAMDTPEDGVNMSCAVLSSEGMMSGNEVNRYAELSKSYKKIVVPGTKETLETFVKIPPESLTIKEQKPLRVTDRVIDKTMETTTLNDLDTKYIKEVMQKDIASMVLSVQNAGICLTGYEVEKVEDVLGAYESITLRLEPVEGKSSTFHMKIPTVQSDGTYKANGIRYRIKRQRGDLPIRKISPNKIALTSYYGKTFVSRSSKKVNDYFNWLTNAITAASLDTENQVFTALQPADVFDYEFECSRFYSSLAMSFKGFNLNGFDVTFDHHDREKWFGKDNMALYEKNGALLIGRHKDGYLMLLGANGDLFLCSKGNTQPIPGFEELLKLNPLKAPIDFTELKVMGKTVALGVILAYDMGFENLLTFLKAEYRRVPAGQRLRLMADEFSIVFSDETIVVRKSDPKVTLVLGGFNEVKKSIRDYSVYDFDRKDVYYNVLDSTGVSGRYLKEIDLMYRMFIDPITKELLVGMGEPTDFRGLILRANELLVDDQHPHEMDAHYMRDKGYERFSGAVYGELVRSIRAHNSRAGKSKYQMEMNPYAVWKTITSDPAMQLVNEINPIQNLKEQEAITFMGTGGRGSRSMTKKTRIYSAADMGVVSESTVATGDVGINIFTSANPKYVSLRGQSGEYDYEKDGMSSLLSTSALLAVGSVNDDPKRVNFVGIQASHVISCPTYRVTPVRTGYEAIVAQRTDDMFAYAAKRPGKVVSVTDRAVVIEYDDGERVGLEIGRRYGMAAGLIVPHMLVSNVAVGQKFDKGHVVTYNNGFFEPDRDNPWNVNWKSSVMVNTALLESPDTLEDSSAIYADVANLLKTNVTKQKNIVVRFDQHLRKMVKEGDHLESDDILCYIEDQVTADTNLFDDESLETLRLLSAQAPLAKAHGVVERIEVYYNGELEDMSDSIRSLAIASDRRIKTRYASLGKPIYNGSVDEGFRVEGNPLLQDTAVVRLYITGEVPAGVGDKGVFCNQLKTVFGKVYQKPIESESGQKIEAIFGRKSIAARIVNSPDIIGTTSTLLEVVTKKALEIYHKK